MKSNSFLEIGMLLLLSSPCENIAVSYEWVLNLLLVDNERKKTRSLFSTTTFTLGKQTYVKQVKCDWTSANYDNKSLIISNK